LELKSYFIQKSPNIETKGDHFLILLFLLSNKDTYLFNALPRKNGNTKQEKGNVFRKGKVALIPKTHILKGGGNEKSTRRVS